MTAWLTPKPTGTLTITGNSHDSFSGVLLQEDGGSILLESGFGLLTERSGLAGFAAASITLTAHPAGTLTLTP
jgi:hypothetical protein